ncbi:HAD-IIIC family phosphatase [Acetobacter sp.]|uniref:HAD-IIIC family phosphatase n=1 Tax=Acetobacter sp. TaxID=440 RepID=UPI0039E830EA
MHAQNLFWLPSLDSKSAADQWNEQFTAMNGAPSNWDGLVALARHDLDFTRTMRLERLLTRKFPQPPPDLPVRPVRLAILGSSTINHLAASIRVAALRRGMWAAVHIGEYGSYLQELSEPDEALKHFAPTAFLLLFDAHHITGYLPRNADQAAADAAFSEVTQTLLPRCWRAAKEHYNCPVLQTSFLPILPRLMGSAETSFPASPAGFIERLNAALPALCMEHTAIFLDLAGMASRNGIAFWHNPSLWLRAKQEIAPCAAPVFGELVGRSLAGMAGKASKCLVLDLDNTLWGGVIGDDGLTGIELGQGSPIGEAYLAIQDYALRLSGRGIILAVCSKNDEPNAREPFCVHPEMLLREKDIACFVVNWDDKAENIREIARRLKIGLDSLVFADDNPFERARVREALPMVEVPELPDDPALIPETLAAAGYFDLPTLSAEDLARSGQYQANIQRAALQENATDLDSYLANLNMNLSYGLFNIQNLPRITQLINKSNQFNLTTRRYTHEDLVALMQDSAAFGLWFRLTDRFGDNGLIAVIIGRDAPDKVLEIDTWLMSCRVLGRGVEEATLGIIAAQAKQRGAAFLRGLYFPTAKNGMVANLYTRLGFAHAGRTTDGGEVYLLPLETWQNAPTHIVCTK